MLPPQLTKEKSESVTALVRLKRFAVGALIIVDREPLLPLWVIFFVLLLAVLLTGR